MIVYHMSESLRPGMLLCGDYKENAGLIIPFVQALERSEDCFYGMLLCAKLQKAVLSKFGLQDMATNYVKWATEAIFEMVRRTEYPAKCSRISGTFFFSSVDEANILFMNYWSADAKDSVDKVRLFTVELEDDNPERYDMEFFDKAFDAMWNYEDIQEAYACTRSYFRGERQKILSGKF